MASTNLSNIVNQIVQNERTGSLLCVDDKGKLGRVYFLKGRAVNARYDRLQGREALDHVIQLRTKSTRFHEGRDMVRSKHAIQESSVAKNSGQAVIPNKVAKNELDHSTTAPAMETMRDATGNGLTPELKILLRDELAEHIGPVAQIVVDSLDDQISLKDAVVTLATEIGERNAAIRFTKAMKEKTYF